MAVGCTAISSFCDYGTNNYSLLPHTPYTYMNEYE